MTHAGLRPLVEDLDFTLSPGETLAIAGESGSGKSITSLAIMGLLPRPAVRITDGMIRFADRDLVCASESEMRRLRGSRIAMIFQEPMTSLNPILRIGTQLTEAIRAHEAIGPAQARSLALAALRAVRLSEPERRLAQYPHELSGGMRQRVMIAMALALKPDLLIADEPTTALDVTVQREVLDLLRDLQRDTGTAIILITHDMGVVAEMADRVVVMQRGRKVEEGSVHDIFKRPRHPYTQSLLAAVPRMGPGRVATAADSEAVAQLDDVSVQFDIKSGLLQRTTHRIHAVEHVSLTVRQGEIFALVGESGCGKSTIAKAMVGLVPHEGRIEIAGLRVAGNDTAMRRRLSRMVQIVFQDPMAALDPRMTVGALVAEPLLIHGAGDAAARRDRAAELFRRVGLEADHLDRYPHEFSGGQRQRICIARALALQPRLLIADESVSALDVSVQARVLALLESLKREFGIACLFISHDMAVVENIADRVAVMRLGQIIEQGTGAQVFSDPRHHYTRVLMASVPTPDPDHRAVPQARASGDVPSPIYPVADGPSRFVLEDVGDGHLVAGD